MTAPSHTVALQHLENGTAAYQHTALAGTSHGFFTIKGGTSAGDYASLNAGPGSQDAPLLVAQNRALAAQGLGFAPDQLCGLYQYHSADIITYAGNALPDERPKADGLVTNNPELALAILTADCAPIFLVDSQAGVIGACHAGWRGAVSGVIENTVSAMAALGAASQRIVMVIGPTIAQTSYQVGAEMREAALTEASSDKAALCFATDMSAPDKWLFDLPRFCTLAGESAGITEIYNTGIDTYSSADLCFSHRRATHQGLADTGRLISIVSLKSPL